MTTPTSAPATDDAATDDHAETPHASEEVESPPSAEEKSSPNSEAARYRVQLREAEAARDALAERITGYQRRECEAVVANLLDVPGDLWEIGQADVSTFYDDDGTLNETELQAAAQALVDQRPRLGKPAGPTHQNFGQYAPALPQQLGWDSVVKS